MTTFSSTEPSMKWYIETNTGLIGPFTSKEEASVTKLHEGHSGNIVPRTEQGQTVLLG